MWTLSPSRKEESLVSVATLDEYSAKKTFRLPRLLVSSSNWSLQPSRFAEPVHFNSRRL
jgi:hypothetical protein